MSLSFSQLYLLVCDLAYQHACHRSRARFLLINCWDPWVKGTAVIKHYSQLSAPAFDLRWKKDYWQRRKAEEGSSFLILHVAAVVTYQTREFPCNPSKSPDCPLNASIRREKVKTSAQQSFAALGLLRRDPSWQLNIASRSICYGCWRMTSVTNFKTFLVSSTFLPLPPPAPKSHIYSGVSSALWFIICHLIRSWLKL